MPEPDILQSILKDSSFDLSLSIEPNIMNIQEIFKKMQDGEKVNFNVVESLIGGSTNIFCQFNFKDWLDDARQTITVGLYHPRERFCDDKYEVRLYLKSIEGTIDLVLLIDCFHSFPGSDEKIATGKVRQMNFFASNRDVKCYIYNFSGAEIGDHMRFYHRKDDEPISWRRNYKYGQDEICAMFEFSLAGRWVKISLEREINTSSPYYMEIDEAIKDSVLVFSYILSFCRGIYVTILTKAALLIEGEEIICLEYISRDIKDDDKRFPMFTPMRDHVPFWISFIRHFIQYPEKDRNWFVKQGVWQAISNLCWSDDLDNWTFIKHVAALEGLCKIPPVNLFEGNKELKKYSAIRDNALNAIKIQGEKEGVSGNVINQLIANIHDAKRQLIGYSTKWYIEKALIECNLKGYYDKNSKKIADAINKRNEIVHTGRAESEYNFFEYIKLIKNIIYLVVLSRLEYPGEFYFSDNEHKQLTSLKEHS